MSILQIGVLLLVGMTGTAVALICAPKLQVIAMSLFGLTLALLFAVFQAPDVALSQLTVGAVALPLMVLLTLAQLEKKAK